MAHFVDYFPVPNKIEQLRDQKQALSRFRAENDQISMCDTVSLIPLKLSLIIYWQNASFNNIICLNRIGVLLSIFHVPIYVPNICSIF